jgi:uncharacterized membrane protein
MMQTQTTRPESLLQPTAKLITVPKSSIRTLARQTPLTTLTLLILFAFALRVTNIGSESLRGDEAFAIRYWAQSPAEVLRTLAGVEPHPYGTFFSFWAWKSLVGNSEFAMRMLSALINVLGVAGMYAFTRRLLHNKYIALAATLLWTINPNLIWHSQDARNYAMWAALSVISWWLLLRASDRNRRIDWLLYSVSVTIGLYMFFFEALMVVTHLIYIVIYRRQAFKSWLVSVVAIAILLIPWFGQAWALANSGYGGTAVHADLNLLLSKFIPELLFGDRLNTGAPLILNALMLGVIVVCFAAVHYYFPGGTMPTLAMIMVIPALLLVLISTRMSVFAPRYIIAVMPALIVPIATTGVMLIRSFRPYGPLSLRRGVLILITLLGPFTWLTVDALNHYYNGYHKAPDWRTMTAYLKTHLAADDILIMTSPDPATGVTDPAFGYYFDRPDQVVTLPYPLRDTQQVAAQTLASHKNVWLVPAENQTQNVQSALLKTGVLIAEQNVGGFKLRQFRTKTLWPDEMQSVVDISLGDAMLHGFSIEGDTKVGATISVLLYWTKLPDPSLKVFVHLIGSIKADGSPLWTQEDHTPETADRDIYHLDFSKVAAGVYTVEVGVYDPTTAKRVDILSKNGQLLGDSYPLTTLTITVN